MDGGSEWDEKMARFLTKTKKPKSSDAVMIQTMTTERRTYPVINFDKFQGRPGVEIEIKGKSFDCLLDTGARVNVMSWENFQGISGMILERSYDRLVCANEDSLDVKGTTKVDVKMGDYWRQITFVVVKKVTPGMIGGMLLQQAFGIKLTWDTQPELDQDSETKTNYNVCNISARCGEARTDEERIKRAKEILNGRNDGRLEKLIETNGSVFMADQWDVGKTHLAKHVIQTNGGPINVRPYRPPMHLEEKIDEAIENLRRNGIIRKCSSPWNTPLVAVWKKEKKEVRLCMDFRQLNLITERPAFPMPHIEEMMDRLNGAKFFSSIDLGNAYYQVELDKESQEKTAFSTKSGQFCFVRMPFGIAAAPATFQELMTKVLNGMEGAMVYLDDILIFASDMETHFKRLGKVLERVKSAGLRINPEKCQIMRREIKYLGHVINDQGIQTDPEKVKAIKEFEKPKCVKNLRSFLGLCNYYRRFISGYAKKAKALERRCGRGNTKLDWTEECQTAFEEMKEALTQPPILAFPDINKVFILDTDASFEAIGAVLSQKGDDGKERVIAYGSRSMNPHELGYCITRKELLAVYYFCNLYKHYLYGQRFKLRTDHKALTFMVSTKKPITAQFQTWINFLSSLEIEFEYRKGAAHSNADALSRKTCETCAQCLMAHEDAKKEKSKTKRLNVTSEDPNTDDNQTAKEKWQQDSREIDILKRQIKEEKESEFILEEDTIKTKSGKTWIPKEKRREMIKEIHGKLTHAGVEKVARYIGEVYDMEDKNQMIKNTIQACDQCQRVKTYTGKTKEICRETITTERFEKIFMDICGPLKETRNKKQYILAIIDHHSRYLSLTALARQDESTIIEAVQKSWIWRFGAPKEIQTDCGRVFMSKTFRKFVEDMGATVRFSGPHHHQSNGIIERQFRTVRDLLNCSMRERKTSDWASILPEVEFTLNATIQSSINMSPAEAMLGRKIFREKWISQVERGQTKPKERQTEPITRREFKVGDQVLVKIESRDKGQDRFDGPFTITEKLHQRRYMVTDANGRKLDRNIEQLRQFLKEGGCRDPVTNTVD